MFTDLSFEKDDVMLIDLQALGVQGGLSGQQIVDTYADASSGTVVFSINGLSVTLDGWSSTDNLGLMVFDDSPIFT